MKSFGRLTNDKTIFFNCDIQKKFMHHVFEGKSVIDSAGALAKFANLFEIPMVVSEHEKRIFGDTVDEVLKSLDINNSLVLEKFKFSMFVPEVEQFLEKHKERKSIVLYGVEGHICVQQTCLDLLENNFDVHILTDATSSRFEIDRSTAFRRLEKSGAYLTTIESLFFEIMRTHQSSEFKDVMTMLKGKKERNLSSL